MNKRFYTILFAFLFFMAFAHAAQENSFTDGRDGHVYKTMEVNGVTWMTENLNFGRSGWCYDGKKDNCKNYGRLYSWKQSQDVCPEGWRLPSKSEFKKLIEYAGGSYGGRLDQDAEECECGDSELCDYQLLCGEYYQGAGNALKFATGWNNKGNGDNSSGFAAVPAGVAGFVSDKVTFLNKGNIAGFWAKSRKGSPAALRITNDETIVLDESSDDLARSVRCVQGDEDDEEDEAESSGSNYRSSGGSIFRDGRDGKSYKTVDIGGQTWFAENLAYSGVQSRCFSDQNMCEKYGRFYSKNSAADACPEGTHLPSYKDWNALASSVGDASQLISSQENGGYESYSDSYGFSVLFAGRVKYGDHDYLGNAAHFWTSDGYYASFDSGNSYLDIRSVYENREMSIRCVVNSSDYTDRVAPSKAPRKVTPNVYEEPSTSGNEYQSKEENKKPYRSQSSYSSWRTPKYPSDDDESESESDSYADSYADSPSAESSSSQNQENGVDVPAPKAVKRNRYGIHLGLGYVGTWDREVAVGHFFDPDYGYYYGENDPYSGYAGLGFDGGIALKFWLNNYFQVISEFNVRVVDFMKTSDFYYLGSTSGAYVEDKSLEENLMILYLNTPVCIRFVPAGSFYVEAGLELNLNIGASFSLSNAELEFEEEVDGAWNGETFGYGLLFGFGKGLNLKGSLVDVGVRAIVDLSRIEANEIVDLSSFNGSSRNPVATKMWSIQFYVNMYMF